jgi:hypothetical protein
MKREILSFAALLSAIFLTNCSKNSNPPPPPDTSLEITLTDYNTGLIVSGATISLFNNLTDFQNRTNAVDTKATGTNGKAKFTNLATLRYYWYAELGCENNSILPNSTSSVISNQVNNTVNAQIAKIGILKFVNNSSNPYKIYVNGVVVINSMAGNSTQSATFTSGSYDIRVLQLSGYAVTPTDETFTGTLVCGGTLTTTFP